MGLQPLEFSDCYTDSPWFRQSIQEHEESLSRTNSDIKGLVKESKILLSASIDYGKKLESFSKRLKEFTFDSIGENMTDREKNLTSSLKEYGHIFGDIAVVWKNNIEETKKNFYEPLEEFRKSQLQSYKEQKKRFDKQSELYYKLLQNTMALSQKKKKIELLQDQDKELFIEKSTFHSQALDYVFMLQEIQEKKKFEFVAIFTELMKTYFRCYSDGQQIALEQEEYINRTEEQLEAAKAESEDARAKAHALMARMTADPDSVQFMNGRWSRCGYLFITNIHSGVRLTSKWSRMFCTYNKESKLFQYAQPFQTSSSVLTTGRAQNSSSATSVQMDTCMVTSCVGRNTDTIDKRFCFDLEVEELADGAIRTMTCQAINEEDRKKWMMVMDGREPEAVNKDTKRDGEGDAATPTQHFYFNDLGFKLLDNLIGEIERRGVDSEGVYRISGVMSRVEQLIGLSMNPATTDRVDFSNEDEVDFTTLTSSLKSCFRNMAEPVCTYRLHHEFIEACKHPDPDVRFEKIMRAVRKLPEPNRRALKVLTRHLYKVTEQQDVNKMGFSNLSVVFGPTLLRTKQETMSSIMEIKFCNAVVEIFIERFVELFYDGDDGTLKKQQQKATNFVRLPSQRVRPRRRGQMNLESNWETLSKWGSSLAENSEDHANRNPQAAGAGDLICLNSEEDLAKSSSSLQPRFQRSKAFRSHDKPVVHRTPALSGAPGARDKDSDDFSASSPCSTDDDDDPFQLLPLDIDEPAERNGGSHRHHSSVKFQRERSGGVRAPSSRIVDASKRQLRNLVRKASATGGGLPKNESPNNSSSNNNYGLKLPGSMLKTRVMGGSVMMRKHKLGLISGTKTSGSSSFHGVTNRRTPPRPRTSPVVTQRPSVGNDLPSNSGQAVFGYTAQNGDELSFIAGQNLLDLKATESPKWVTATVRGKTGRVPRQLIEFK